MKKKNYLFLLATLLLAPFVICSCDRDDDPDSDPDPTVETKTYGAFILSSGSMGKNNSTLDYYDFETKELNEKVFSSVNGRGLGDTANDMIIYGSKAYIAVDKSGTVEVIDLTGKSIKTISMKSDAGESQEPRYLVAHEGRVYVSTYAGFVAQIDTASLTVERTVEVGSYPEQLCVSNDTLYVTVSGWGIENKIISVNIATFEVADTIEVVVNPTMIQADDQGMLYVLSSGNYYDIKKTLQRINPATGEITELLVNDEISISKGGDYLYAISAEIDPATWLKTSTDYKKYNLKTGALESKSFVNSDVSIENATFTFVDALSNQLYITSGTYSSTGDLYIISEEGALVKKVPLAGINPICVRFVSTEE